MEGVSNTLESNLSGSNSNINTNISASLPSGSPGSVYTEELVCENIINLYANPELIAQANRYLMAFQQDTAAWHICISILNRNVQQISTYVQEAKNVHLELMNCAPSSLPPQCSANVQCVYFASQTLCAQAQAGFPQQLVFHASQPASVTLHEIRNGLCNLIYNYRGGPKQVIRQLAAALCACFIFSHSQKIIEGGGKGGIDRSNIEEQNKTEEEKGGEDPIRYVMEAFVMTEEGFEPLMELLIVLAEEIFNERLSVASENRESFLKVCLKDTFLIWQTSLKIYEKAVDLQNKFLFAHPQLNDPTSSSSAQNVNIYFPQAPPSTLSLPSPLMRSALKCFVAWLNAHLLHAQGEAGGGRETRKEKNLPHDEQGRITEEKEKEKQDISSNNNNNNEEEEEEEEEEDEYAHEKKLRMMIKECGWLNILLKNLISADLEMLQICSDGLTFLMNLLKPKKEESNDIMLALVNAFHQQTIDPLLDMHKQMGGIKGIDATRLKLLTNPLTEMAKAHFPAMLYFCPSVRTPLNKIAEFTARQLSHPDISVKILSLDFWYNLLTHHMPLQNDVVNFSDAEEQANIIAENEAQRELQRLALEPLFQQFVSTLCEEAVYPAGVSVDSEFDFESFQKYRDECAMSLTESTLVVGHQFTLKKAGNQLVLLVDNAMKGNTVLWSDMEACLFVLTTVAPRAPAGADEYIPMALQILPQLPYPSEGLAALILRAAAGRLVLWTAGYIGTQKGLFATLFQLIACELIPFTVDYTCSKENVEVQKNHTECVLVEALNALTAAAGYMLVKDGEEEDTNVVLNALTALIVCDKMSLDNRASLVIGAGSVLAFLPKDRIEFLHMQLVQPLAENMSKILENRGKSSMALGECIKLFFTALQAVRPVEQYTPPPPSVTFEPLPPDSEFRHPVLNVLESHWSLIENVLLNSARIENAIEQAGHSLVTIFSNCRSHAPRYVVFYSFMEALGKSFTLNPTVYHLGALRTIIGIFAYAPDTQQLVVLCSVLQMCVEFTLNKLQEEGSMFVLKQPDLVGMSIDCVNNALIHCLLAQRVLTSPWFASLIQICLQLTPTCHHPKVLHTCMVLISRVVAWVDPPPHLYSFQPGLGIPWLQPACEETQKFVSERMMNNLNADGQTYLQNIFSAVIGAVVNVHTGVQSWIGSATQSLMPLLANEKLGPTAKLALKKAMDDIPSDLLSVDRREHFYLQCLHESSPRQFSSLLQTLADEARGQWKRSQYKLNS